MDENYLDQLLKGLEHPDSDASDMSELSSMEASLSDSGDMLEETLTADAGHINDIAWSDSEIPMEEISELDELDQQADMDMEAMDFDDIDFDDLDVTKMDVNPVPLQKDLENVNELDIDEMYLDESEDDLFEQEFRKLQEEEPTGRVTVADLEDSEPVSMEMVEEAPAPEAEEAPAEAVVPEAAVEEVPLDTALQEEVPSDTALQEEEDSQHTENDSSDIDALFQEVFGEIDAPKEEEAPSDAEEPAESGSDMDDLFSMLGIEENSKMASQPIPEEDEIPDFEIPPELADVEEVKKEPKKKTFWDILFGEDDEEDELTPEQEEALAKAKEEKLQAKLEKKEQRKAKKAESDAKKRSNQADKTAKVAAKKAAKKEEEERLLAEEGPEKKLNKVLVAIVMLFFLGVGGFVIIGTSVFDYTLVIAKATNYFERQRYGLAYREILGVEVKEQHQELEAQIYTVMYVERQYEAYQNYVILNQPDLALDALLQGLDKYDVYYDDAVALGIVDDLNIAKTKILAALTNTYGLSETEAKEILQMDDRAYTSQIQDLTTGMDFSVSQDSAVEGVTE
ncbi:MAG: hypothetical protein NC089_00855 [Bacteroides sp.]|nr:hypothetical protein [Bacteroides sp.]MCM1550494.1 hypothetical protein [Clostridium sp.]